MKTKTKLFALLLLLAAIPMFLSCGKHDPYVFDGINWDGDAGGTLELVNGSNKDMILFVGKTPATSSILGGVKAGATRQLDISRHVDDFSVGGYAILRGVSKEEYDKNPDVNKAKVEFNAMVTYRAGAVYRYNIDLNYIGDNGFRVSNNGRIGLELRKDSPYGEKVAYLPALQQNQMVYTQTTAAIYLFPVYVFYNKNSQEVTTLQSTDMFEGVRAAPRPLMGSSGIQDYTFPNDPSLTWEKIVGSLKSPSAYLTITNNVRNQAAYFTVAGSNRLPSQNGYDAVGSGEQLTFEIESTEEGSPKSLIVQVYTFDIPVLFEGEVTNPVIKNGYDYSISVNVTGTGRNREDYSATITEGKKRDLSKEIESL